MKILKNERPKPKWIVAPPSLELWRGKPGCKAHPGKIGGLPLSIRDELNVRLQRGEPPARLVKWLNGLPESPSASHENCRHGKVTVGDIADWKRGGFRDWELGQERRMTIARRCLAWAKTPNTQDKLFGRRLTWLEILNQKRRAFGLEPLTRDDLPADQDWDAIPTREQRRIARNAILGLTPEGKPLDKSSPHPEYFEPPHTGSASKKTINPKRK